MNDILPEHERNPAPTRVVRASLPWLDRIKHRLKRKRQLSMTSSRNAVGISSGLCSLLRSSGRPGRADRWGPSRYACANIIGAQAKAADWKSVVVQRLLGGSSPSSSGMSLAFGGCLLLILNCAQSFGWQRGQT